MDVALVLAVDSSGSIGNEDLALQFDDYAQAIIGGGFMSAVRSGQQGALAITFVAWSSARWQDQVVPWMRIDGMSAARRFVGRLLQAPGSVMGLPRSVGLSILQDRSCQ